MPPIKVMSDMVADLKKPWGVIRFIHKDGTEHQFYSYINDMTGNRLSAFDSTAPTIGEMPWVKSVFRDIHVKAQVLEVAGPLAQAQGQGKD